MEFLNLLCNLYIIGLTAALPLYTQGTYSQLGDTKYLLFRNLSALCLGLWLVGAAVEGLRRVGERKRALPTLSAMDICVLSYGGTAILSALLSDYGKTAWLGYMEWYMGALSQLLFVGIYFFVSRCYDGKRYPVVLGITAFFLTVIFGMLHRLGIDPLGLMRDFNTGDWTYSHMFSTVGNINWFCGYCSVALALPVAGCLKGKDKRVRCLLYPVAVCGLFLLFIQGSDIGVILTAMCLLVCLLWGIRDGAVFERTLLLAAGLFFMIPAYGMLASFLGEGAVAALPADSIGWGVIRAKLWWAAGAAALCLWLLLRSLARRSHASAQKTVRCVSAGAPLLALLLGVAFFLARQPSGEMWGSGRGALWRIALQGFERNGWLRRLVGVGPDCFAEYIYSVFSGDALSFQEGRWAGSIYANAHNEWLNHLVNLGIMGTGCYIGIFVTGAIRYRKYLSGVLALTLYGVASLTGFQQCLSTPLLFLALGMCERNEDIEIDTRWSGQGGVYEMEEVQDKDSHGGGGYHHQRPV